MNAIRTERLRVGYDRNIVVPDFSASFVKGKMTSIIGPNGCGKSTVLKAIGRIIKSESGSVVVNDRDLKEMKNKEIARMMAILPQSPNAPSSITCFDLVAYGRYPYQRGLGRLTKEDRDVILWSLRATNMEEFASRPIAFLSGGQRQRVWIAMALAQQTDIILLDEPTTYLDLNHQLEVLELLSRLNREQHVTIVMVLHDLNLASRYSDVLLAMKEGRVVRIGTPSEVLTHEILRECFSVDGEIMLDEERGKPFCFNYTLLRKGGNENES